MLQSWKTSVLCTSSKTPWMPEAKTALEASLQTPAPPAQPRRRCISRTSRIEDLVASILVENKQTQRSSTPACPPSCHAGDSTGWCHHQVQQSTFNWPHLFQLPPGALKRVFHASGNMREYRHGPLTILLVETPKQLKQALKLLRKSMKDPVLGIDLEWRRSYGGRPSKVALMQLASADTCVLVRFKPLHYKLTAPLMELLMDPTLVFAGFAWASSDEAMMQQTFAFGRENFPEGRFFDVQDVAFQLGFHHHTGLAFVTRHTLGASPPKSTTMAKSKWDGDDLSNKQIQYAALDAFSTGHAFRKLRQLHHSGAPCTCCGRGWSTRQQALEALQPGLEALLHAPSTSPGPQAPQDAQPASPSSSSSSSSSSISLSSGSLSSSATASSSNSSNSAAASCSARAGVSSGGGGDAAHPSAQQLTYPIFTCVHPRCGFQRTVFHDVYNHGLSRGHCISHSASSCLGCGRHIYQPLLVSLPDLAAEQQQLDMEEEDEEG
eukprot:CAMPEP_0202890680 /NCGR_PEP_ID=MMETSP1392-20130828/1004_1 /ASSEMBLY_ACC=CAM_ASM_000868 /TAXON_ID=225041 /ORGANISM="Chlamydomonas chlamydogama, Strain SAG 11-48b" /LENGTH=492 /DNA_ID=CAMNT_0049574297 /DNA_START=108 /DNA_END=1583 /DNA_ORIENTATION=-